MQMHLQVCDGKKVCYLVFVVAYNMFNFVYDQFEKIVTIDYFNSLNFYIDSGQTKEWS